jgi:DNA polymerase-4
MTLLSRLPATWPRAIALVDMNAFFASIEQRDFPALAGRPVAITNGLLGTCVITCSYEARRDGVKTGMRLPEARRLCPDLIRRPTRPQRYAQVSERIMACFKAFTPRIEIFSVDEAFLDLSRCLHLPACPESIGRLIKQRVFAHSGLKCSVGISGDKSTAKFAAKLNKPDGLTIIAPQEARARLCNEPVTVLCGVNTGISRYLAGHGAYTCAEVARLPISVLARRFGNPGRRIWLMCQGLDPEAVKETIPAAKTLGHGKVIPPRTRDRETLLTYLTHMASKVAARLRKHELASQTYEIYMLAQEGWLGRKYSLAQADNATLPLTALCRRMLAECWRGQGISQVHVCALKLRPQQAQQDLFCPRDEKREHLYQAIDAVNHRFGEFAIMPAALINRSQQPDVIAPAWKPSGHRQTLHRPERAPGRSVVRIHRL